MSEPTRPVSQDDPERPSGLFLGSEPLDRPARLSASAADVSDADSTDRGDDDSSGLSDADSTDASGTDMVDADGTDADASDDDSDAGESDDEGDSETTDADAEDALDAEGMSPLGLADGDLGPADERGAGTDADSSDAR
jgi:hypothetical protein